VGSAAIGQSVHGCGCHATPAAPAPNDTGGADAAPAPEWKPAPRGSSAPADAHAGAKANASKWVNGDTKGLDPVLFGKLAQLGEQLDSPVHIASGYRSNAEQQALYAKYRNGTGNLAAKPGTSNHEHGDAADASVHGTSLASDTRARALAAKLGLVFPVKGEPWHTELRSKQ
jgi:hypothetical protein